MPPYCNGNPHSTHRPLENEEEEDNATTPIVRQKQNSCQQRVSDDQDPGHSVIPFVANDIQIHCEDREGNFQVPHRASNSSFSVDNEDKKLDDGFIEDEYVP